MTMTVRGAAEASSTAVSKRVKIRMLESEL
jgi:hypothetical protein